MKVTKTLIFLLLLPFLSLVIQASTINPTPRKLTQPNGTSFFATTYGNAWFKWQETQSGLVIILNKETGYYDYAVIREVNGEKTLIPSGIKVESKGKPGAHSQAFNQVKRKDIQPLIQAALKRKHKTPRTPQNE